MAKVAKKLSALQVALKAKPEWKAATPILSDAPIKSVDISTPDFALLKTKYSVGIAAQDSVKKSPPRKVAEDDNMTMVTIEPKVQSDAYVGRKSVLVHKGKIVGEQG